MFIKKIDYRSLLDELSRAQDEISFFRKKYKEQTQLKEKVEEKLQHMYEQARLDAATRSRIAGQLIQKTEELEHIAKEKKEARKMAFTEFQEFLNPEPNDPEIRKAYVSQISGYFYGGLNDYLKYMQSLFKNQVVMFPLTEREADFYRAGVNVIQLMLEWGEQMAKEHIANSRGEEELEDAFDAEDESVENIKDALNR